MEYHEWSPSQLLRGIVLAYWRVSGGGSAVPSPAILPDAHIEIVANLGDPVMLTGPAYSGRQPARTVVGLLNHAVRMRYGRNVRAVGIRLHPARAAAFLGVPARALANTIVPLHSLSRTLDAALRRSLREHSNVESEMVRVEVEQLLVEHLKNAAPFDGLVARAVDQLLNAEESVSVTRLAQNLGVSPRLLHRRFLAVVGTAPKRLERLARFARAWQQATMGPPFTWADLALANGYADQAHLVREFRAFGAEPPAHLFTPEWYDAASLECIDRDDSDS